MLMGFLIWTACAVVLLVIGILSWISKKPAGFFAGVEPPKVTDVKKYNHAVGALWFVYTVLFELLGMPFLFYRQNSPQFIITLLGTVAITLGLVIGYHFILSKYEAHR